MLYLAYALHSHILNKEGSEENKMSIVQIQVNYQTRELNMIAIILQYKKYFLIILLLCIL